MRCQYCHNPDTWATEANGLARLGSIKEAIHDILRYVDYYRASGGGLTVSGGEPLLQAPFVTELFRAVKRDLGLDTALDTSGVYGATSNRDAVISLLDQTDLLLLDIKSTLPARHLELTGWHLDYVLSREHR